MPTALSEFARSATGWLIDRALSIILAVTVQLTLIRSLGASGFGELSYLLAITAMLSPLVVAGASGFVTRALLQSPNDSERILKAAIGWRLAGALLSIVIATIYWLTIESGEPSRAILVLLVISQTALVFQVVELHFQSRLEQRLIVYWRLPTQIIGAGAKIFSATVTTDPLWVAAAFSVDFALQGTAYYFSYFHSTKSRLTARRDPHWTPWLVSRSKWLLASAFAEMMYLKVDILMLDRIAGSEETGIYAAAAKISEVWYFIPIVMMNAWYPLLWRGGIGNSTDRYRLQTMMDGFTVAAISIALFVQLTGDQIIQTLMGQQFSESADVLQVHIWAGIFIFMRAILSKWLVAHDLPRISLLTHLLGAISNVALNLILIPKYGALGAAYATIASYAIASWLALYASPRTRPIANMMILSIMLPFRFRSLAFYARAISRLLK